jgi:hypothetical protein
MKSFLLVMLFWIVVFLGINYASAQRTHSKPILEILYERLIGVESRMAILENRMRLMNGVIQETISKNNKIQTQTK